MYIVSENENLLERLGLLVLNSNILNGVDDDDQPEPAEFIATLASCRHYCEPKSNFLVLVAKWDQLMLDTVADLTRLLMAHSSHGQGNIVVIKKDADSNDEEILQNHIVEVKQKWAQEWTFQLEKTRNLPNSEARTEALNRIENWTSPKLPNFSLLNFENADLARLITVAFDLRNGLKIKDGFPNRPTLFSKPPALHWSHFPRDSEMQIMFKFTFPVGTIPDPVFRDFAHSAKEAFDFEYFYEWKSGIFIRHELTKISVYRTNSHTIEVAGRIDTDEYAAEVEDDTQAENPFKIVWPLLARVLKTIVRDCIEYQTDNRLPYHLNLAFFGSSFFRDLNYVDVNGPVNARLLDATQAFAAIERTGSIKFGVGKRLMMIETKLAFPGFQPSTFSDLFALSDFPVASSRNSTSSSRLSPAPSIGQSLATTVILEQQNEDDSLPDTHVSPPHSAQLLGFSERSNSQTGLLGMGMAAAKNQNRGRRVSFGGIKAPCPKTTNLKKNNQHDAGSLSSLSRGELNIGPSPAISQTSVNDYVDQMLQKTIDEVLVMD